MNNARRWSYSRGKVVEDAVPGVDAWDVLILHLAEKEK